MKRTALLCAALFVTAASLMYLANAVAVRILCIALCITIFLYIIICKIKHNSLNKRIVAVILIAILFCVYLLLFVEYRVESAERLVGCTKTVTCDVVEEPYYNNGYTELKLKTDGSNDFDSNYFNRVKFKLYVGSYEEISNALEGDKIKATVRFSKLDDAFKRYNLPEEIYISAKCISAEVTEHNETLYTRCIDIRRGVRKSIDNYTANDTAALLKGLLLGDISDMSDELYSNFKICGVCHITAVSGMHIGAFSMMVTTLLSLFLSRRPASLLAMLPLVATVALAGFTPSAVRAGIMCFIALIGNCLLKRTDGLNSLGCAIAIMLVYNPFYVCSLSFQLSCSAAMGVIIVSPYGMRLANRLVKREIKFVSNVCKAVILILVQSVGAVVCTMPFQIIDFGFISVVAPLSSVLIQAASVYAMGITVLGVVFHYVPIIDLIAIVPFFASELLADYIIVVVNLLSKLPFSYIAFGNNMAVLWLGFSMALASLWIFLERPLKMRTISIMITALLLVSLWSVRLTSNGMVEVAVLDADGLCTAVSYDGKCVIIGTGEDKNSKYIVNAYLKQQGITEVEALLVSSPEDIESKEYTALCEAVKPEMTVIPDVSFKTIDSIEDLKIISNGQVIYFNDERVKISAVCHEFGCAYIINACDKCFVVGDIPKKSDILGTNTADFIISHGVVPKDFEAKLAIISSEHSAGLYELGKVERVVTTQDRIISVKLKKGKEITVYAGQK